MPTWEIARLYFSNGIPGADDEPGGSLQYSHEDGDPDPIAQDEVWRTIRKLGDQQWESVAVTQIAAVNGYKMYFKRPVSDQS